MLSYLLLFFTFGLFLNISGWKCYGKNVKIALSFSKKHHHNARIRAWLTPLICLPLYLTVACCRLWLVLCRCSVLWFRCSGQAVTSSRPRTTRRPRWRCAASPSTPGRAWPTRSTSGASNRWASVYICVHLMRRTGRHLSTSVYIWCVEQVGICLHLCTSGASEQVEELS